MSQIASNKARKLFSIHIWPLLMWATFFEAAVVIVKNDQESKKEKNLELVKNWIQNQGNPLLTLIQTRFLRCFIKIEWVFDLVLTKLFHYFSHHHDLPCKSIIRLVKYLQNLMQQYWQKLLLTLYFLLYLFYLPN